MPSPRPPTAWASSKLHVPPPFILVRTHKGTEGRSRGPRSPLGQPSHSDGDPSQLVRNVQNPDPAPAELPQYSRLHVLSINQAAAQGGRYPQQGRTGSRAPTGQDPGSASSPSTRLRLRLALYHLHQPGCSSGWVAFSTREDGVQRGQPLSRDTPKPESSTCINSPADREGPRSPRGPAATYLSLKSRKTLASVLPPTIMDTSMALRKL